VVKFWYDKIGSVVLCEVANQTNRQTERQTPSKHNLLGVGN